MLSSALCACILLHQVLWISSTNCIVSTQLPGSTSVPPTTAGEHSALTPFFVPHNTSIWLPSIVPSFSSYVIYLSFPNHLPSPSDVHSHLSDTPVLQAVHSCTISYPDATPTGNLVLYNYCPSTQSLHHWCSLTCTSLPYLHIMSSPFDKHPVVHTTYCHLHFLPT